MKLRKALEKAKRERELAISKEKMEENRIEILKPILPIPKMLKSQNVAPEKLEVQYVNYEWKAPIYAESKEVTFDLKKAEENRCISLLPDAKEIEYYKILRTQILNHTKRENLNTIMITSVMPDEGKSLTAINLSVTFAKEFNQTVLLVDCDLRRQMIHKYLGIDSDKGIVDCFLNQKSLQEIILWPGIEKLTLISGGKTIADSAEILGSEHMKTMVTDLKNRYSDRYIIFDVPPMLAGADAMVFAQLVDRIIMVVESGRTSIQDINRALELIPKEKFLGFVLNKHEAPVDSYAYYYRS